MRLHKSNTQYLFLLYLNYEPLYLVMFSGKLYKMSLMITHGDTLNKQVMYPGGYCRSPLNVAIANSQLSIVKLLLESGADTCRVVNAYVPYIGLDSWRVVLLLRKYRVFRTRDSFQLNLAVRTCNLVYMSLFLTTADYQGHGCAFSEGTVRGMLVSMISYRRPFSEDV